MPQRRRQFPDRANIDIESRLGNSAYLKRLPERLREFDAWLMISVAPESTNIVDQAVAQPTQTTIRGAPLTDHFSLSTWETDQDKLALCAGQDQLPNPHAKGRD